MQTAAARTASSILNTTIHGTPLTSHAPSLLLKATAPRNMRPRPTRHALPSAWYRAGTSKGLFIQRRHLPRDMAEWSQIILSAMGSQDGDPRQLNGLGGGAPTTSKVAVVECSAREDIDLEYTFIQVVPDSGKLDMTGNCGNIASGVGPYALDEELIAAPVGQDKVSIRILNTNTNKIMEAVVKLDSYGHACEQGAYRMPGLRSEGSPIDLSFLDPSGSMTGKMLPTGNAWDWLEIHTGMQTFSVRSTLIDVANPFVLVDHATLPDVYHQLGPQANESLRLIEDIRRVAAVKFGLADSIQTAALTRGTPKVAVLSPPTDTLASIYTTSFSTGRVHPSVQLTGAVCIAAATVTPGTIAWGIASRPRSGDVSPSASVSSRSSSTDLGFVSERGSPASQGRQKVTIGHASGQIDVEVSCKLDGSDQAMRIDSVTVTRTARRLFEGKVFYDL